MNSRTDETGVVIFTTFEAAWSFGHKHSEHIRHAHPPGSSWTFIVLPRDDGFAVKFHPGGTWLGITGQEITTQDPPKPA